MAHNSEGGFINRLGFRGVVPDSEDEGPFEVPDSQSEGVSTDWDIAVCGKNILAMQFILTTTDC